MFAQDAAFATASAIANAATYSAARGTSFGDNLVRAIPDVVGQLLGRVAGRGIGTAFDGISSSQEQVTANPVSEDNATTGQGIEVFINRNAGASFGYLSDPIDTWLDIETFVARGLRQHELVKSYHAESQAVNAEAARREEQEFIAQGNIVVTADAKQVAQIRRANRDPFPTIPGITYSQSINRTWEQNLCKDIWTQGYAGEQAHI